MIVKRISYLESNPSQLEKIGYFLDSNLRENYSFSIIEEYPSVFEPYPGGQSFYIELDDIITSHVLTLIRTFYHPHFKLKIGLIGSVVTAPKFRGQGMAKKLLQNACEYLKKENCEICILWSGNHKLYEPLGFHRAGREKDIVIGKRELSTDNNIIVRECDITKDASNIWKLYLKHEGHVDRSLEEQKRLCRIPKTRIFVTEKANKISSYIAINKGADFENYIHEWGGDISDIVSNIMYIQKNFTQNDLVLIAPFNFNFENLGPVEDYCGVLGLIKVLNKKKLLTTYQTYLQTLNIKGHYISTNDTFSYDNEDIILSSDKDVLDLVFGIEEGNFKDSLKLPFFLWGFDSI